MRNLPLHAPIGRAAHKAAPLVALAVLANLIAWSPAVAVNPDEMLSDPALEARARSLSSELRCLVCRNQSIDDSNADLARDLRLLVRERLQAGDSDAQTEAFIVARYGNFVLLKPPVQWNTALLWAGPALFLAVAAFGAFRWVRLRAPLTASDVPAPLSADEEVQIQSILREKELL